MTSHSEAMTPARLDELIAELYDMRDAAKRVLGDSYVARMAVLRGFISVVQRRDDCDELTAAATIAKGTQANAWQNIFIMAAAVEMIEPSALSPGELR